MLRNYFKIALRNLWRSPGYTAINIAGLAIGVACCLTMTMFVLDELSYDTFHEKADRIYRVVNERHAEGDMSHAAVTPPAYAPMMKQEFPEVAEAVRFFDLGRVLIRYEDRQFFEEKAYLADSAVFKVFSLPLKRGDPVTALTAPNTLVLAESVAEKYFGDEDPMGNTLIVGDAEWTITGVLFDPPRQSHLDLRVLGSFQTMYTFQTEERLSNWRWQQFFTYVLLHEGLDPRSLEARLPAFLDRFADPNTLPGGFSFEAHLQPLTDIHLRSSHLTFDFGRRGNIAHVWAFSGIALFVLLIACFNFMNLSTARGTNRALEVGMRKVIGARRAQLIGQFLGESTLMAFASLFVALLLTEIILPHFNRFVGKELDIVYASGWVLPVLLALGLMLGFIAGSYPALYLSSFRPAHVLKGDVGAAGGGITTIRRMLVVTQFAITIALIIGTAVVYRQLQFTRNTDLGFQRDLLVKVPLVENMTANVDAIKAELARHSSIASVTASWGTPGGFLAGDGVRLPGRESEWGLRVVSTDYDFITSYGMRMAAGRDFSRDHPSDEHEAFIINEAAAQEQGWTPDEAVGKELSWDMWAEEGVKRGRVIGVVENFHYGPLRNAIEPVMINIHPVYGNLSIRIRPGGVTSALGAIRTEWDKWVSSWPFEYTFLEEELAEQYVSEEKLARVCAVFAGLAVIIACLGLFGLASFIVGRRTKEIGIRKVMGASVERIVLLLSRDFAMLVMVAFLIAMPIAYLFANAWLEDFVYRIDIEPLVFIIAGLVSLVIAISTVSYHTIRTALSDPIKSLRYE